MKRLLTVICVLFIFAATAIAAPNGHGFSRGGFGGYPYLGYGGGYPSTTVNNNVNYPSSLDITVHQDYAGGFQAMGWADVHRTTWGDGENHSQMLINPFCEQKDAVNDGITNEQTRDRIRAIAQRKGINVIVNVPPIQYVVMVADTNVYGVYTTKPLADKIANNLIALGRKATVVQAETNRK
jgi:hypothetical protein